MLARMYKSKYKYHERQWQSFAIEGFSSFCLTSLYSLMLPVRTIIAVPCSIVGKLYGHCQVYCTCRLSCGQLRVGGGCTPQSILRWVGHTALTHFQMKLFEYLYSISDLVLNSFFHFQTEYAICHTVSPEFHLRVILNILMRAISVHNDIKCVVYNLILKSF